jgi:hypothetical protein
LNLIPILSKSIFYLTWTLQSYEIYKYKNLFVSYRGGHNRVHGSHYAHMHKPAPAPAMGHHRSAEGRLPGKNAPMHDKVHNMGNHNAHKAPNREVAMNTRSNHGGSGHFGGHR